MKGSDRIFDYLNGHLSETEQREFEAMLEQNEALADEVRTIKAEITVFRDRFDMMSAPEYAGVVPRPFSSSFKRKLRRIAPGLFAAAILIAGLLLWDRFAVKPGGREKEQRVYMVTATDNPRINIYTVDGLPGDLWQGGEP